MEREGRWSCNKITRTRDKVCVLAKSTTNADQITMSDLSTSISTRLPFFTRVMPVPCTWREQERKREGKREQPATPTHPRKQSDARRAQIVVCRVWDSVYKVYRAAGVANSRARDRRDFVTGLSLSLSFVNERV
jgi:hypothetical protein